MPVDEYRLNLHHEKFAELYDYRSLDKETVTFAIRYAEKLAVLEVILNYRFGKNKMYIKKN